MANGYFGGGDGTSANPFLIEDADDLNSIRKHLSSSYKIVNDINLADGKYNVEQGWNPIDDFIGALDGQNHKLINLYINRPAQDNVGLFGHVYANNTITINNLQIIDCDITGHNQVGALLGYNENPSSSNVFNGTYTTNNVYVKGKINGNANMSGLIGYIGIVGLMNRSTNNAFCATFSINLNNVFCDVNITSNDNIAYGITRVASHAISGWNNYNCNCNCNCWTNAPITFTNCFTIMHKNDKILTYYAICNPENNNNTYACYTDNTEISPIIYSGTDYANLQNIKFQNGWLPKIDPTYYNKQIAKQPEPVLLNLNNIYVFFNNGYYTYDLSTKTWTRKYTTLDNNNSKKIIQNGMNKLDFNHIPQEVWVTLSKQYSEIKVVNCINAHDKILYHESRVTLPTYTTSESKNIVKKKIKFEDFNNNITKIIK
jgi:hypothetical protein